jgi:uncharacterized lipoprotein YehR (DUF1307 family)
MRSMKWMLTTVTAMGLACGLAGCGQSPGDPEVREAIKGRFESLGLGPSGAKEAKEFDETLLKIKVIGCKKAEGSNGFNCDWTGADSFAPVVSNSGRIVKSEKGWMLAMAGG